MLASIAAALLLQSATPASQAAPDCSYDRAAMLKLELMQFDQDMTGGWRALADRGCNAEAADLIRDWRAANPVSRQRTGLLNWHEGQLRASAGQINAAIALLAAARKTPEEDAGFGWNLYVDGTIAFLRRHPRAFATARDTLAALPKPEGYAPRGPDGKPVAIRWPMNLNVLDALQRCWGQPYRTAYVCPPPR